MAAHRVIICSSISPSPLPSLPSHTLPRVEACLVPSRRLSADLPPQCHSPLSAVDTRGLALSGSLRPGRSLGSVSPGRRDPGSLSPGWSPGSFRPTRTPLRGLPSPKGPTQAHRAPRHPWHPRCDARRAEIVQFSPDDFSVDRLLGTLGFLNVASYSPPSPGQGQWGVGLGLGDGEGGPSAPSGLSIADLNRMMGQGTESQVQIRLYQGRIVTRGERLGTRVILKAYPGRASSGGSAALDADALSANELVTHFALQGTDDGEVESEDSVLSPHVSVLLGGFETSTGEKWLVLRDDGFLTAADYARYAAQATMEGSSLGLQNFFDLMDKRRPIRRREQFILAIFRGALKGLAYMHSRGRLHQSLGPASVVLNTIDESELLFVVPRLRDFAFSVDISDPATLSGAGEKSVGAVQEARDNLWRRARSASASTIFERKAFGIADDIYSAGLLLAYLAFLPLCPPNSIDGPSLQRLLETTFQLDVQAAREYCAADDRWAYAVAFLDRNSGSGWDLLQAMLNPDYRKRPTADTVLLHPFFA